ncbi:MAG TPA: acetyl-CoA carboxylase biotin carboxylase subunit [Planctomycetes bacterium]|nr:acetyl-CoA carboxylase biotin carboxylase subunit [Planctomycetota bacterium]
MRRVLVANRGEIAIRVFQACRERGIDTVAVYSEADRDAPHRFAADEAVLIGASAAADSYLRIDRIIEAATSTGTDAIHPGYGFLSENAAFAAAVEEADLIFIGPTPDQIETMGDKIRARELMVAAGVPVIPGTETPISDEKQLRREAKKIGYPLLLKAAGGGGGKGIRRVDSSRGLTQAWQRTRSEASAAFGDDRIYLERLIHSARHIEVQVLGDGHGSVWFLGERECSLQRNHQKVLEESPSSAIDDEVRQRLREAAVSGASSINYRGAGTIEFLYEDRSRNFFFLEMNTRLQVEHPVTEMVTGVDLVSAQIDIAEGKRLENDPEIPRRGWAMEFRIYAEDPYRDFRPSTGEIRALRVPHAPFTRIDGAIREGLEITPYYDPMLAKAIAWGEEREIARKRLEALLSRTRIGGIHTNIPLGIEICQEQWFKDGEFDTSTLETWLKDRDDGAQAPEELAILAAVVTRRSLERHRRILSPTDPSGGAWGRAARLEGTGGEMP